MLVSISNSIRRLNVHRLSIEIETSFSFDIIWPTYTVFSDCLWIQLIFVRFSTFNLQIYFITYNNNNTKNPYQFTNECSMTTGIIFCSSPWDHWHHGVVIHVQKWDLSLFFTQHKEYGVQKFRDFSQKVKINTTCFLFLVIFNKTQSH